jgi:cytochrome b subunit of formate dehydrogenase
MFIQHFLELDNENFMQSIKNIWFWFCLVFCPILILAGTYIVGQVSGHYSQSNESLFSSVSSQQLAIIAAAICAVFVLISKIKEAKIRFANQGPNIN